MKSTHTPERLRLLITSAVGTVLVATVAVVPSFRFKDSTSLADAYEASRPVQAEDGHWHEHDPAHKNDLSQSDVIQADGTEGALASSTSAFNTDHMTAIEERKNAANVAKSRTSNEQELVRASFNPTLRSMLVSRQHVVVGVVA